MPVRRPKSCNNCRVAKVRCSLSNPCLRCEKRHVECSYLDARRPSGRRFAEGFRSIKPAVALIRTRTGTAEALSGQRTVGVQDASNNNVSHFDASCTPTLRYPEYVPQPFVGPEPVGLLDPPFSSDINLELPDSLGVFDLSCEFTLPDSSNLCDSFVSTTMPSHTSAIGPQLSQRARSLQQGSLTAKMILSRLTDYTRTMAKGRQMPPFIRPPCFSGDDECPSRSPHQCLPEKLAICVNLTQMFYSRLPGSHSFVWQQIRTHLRQMQAEFVSYDEQGMLEAVQAVVVYGMLCSQCTESVSVEDAANIVVTIESFGRMLYRLCPWGFEVDHLSFSRKKWTVMESLRRGLLSANCNIHHCRNASCILVCEVYVDRLTSRRVGILLYLIDLLLNSNVRTPSKGHCDEFLDIPLPCARDLWQRMSNPEWERRYQDDLAANRRKGSCVLSLRNLLGLRQPAIGVLETCMMDSLEEEFAEWCEKADDLSMLLWMSQMVEGDGRPACARS